MIWLLGAFVFWLALRGELGTYAGFVATKNASGGGFFSDVFGSFSIPVSILSGLKSAAGQGSPAASTSGQPMPGSGSLSSPNVMSPAGQAPGTYMNALGYPTALQTEDAGAYSASSPALGLLKQAQGNVAGGAAGL